MVWVVFFVLHSGLHADALAATQDTLGLVLDDLAEFVRLSQATSELGSDPLDSGHLGSATATSGGQGSIEPREPSPYDTAFAAVVRSVTGFAFAHVGVVGLFANVVFLLAYGMRLEQCAGSLRFALFVVLTLLSAVVLASLVTPTWIDRATYESGWWFASAPVLGGGVLAGAVLGAHLVWHPRCHVLCLVPPVVTRIPTVVAVAAWAALQWRPVQCLLRLGEAEPVPYTWIGCGVGSGLVLSWIVWPQTDKKSALPSKARRSR